MKRNVVMAVLALSAAGSAGAEVTVDATTMELVIPSLTYRGNQYSARLSHEGGCFRPYEVRRLADSGATRATFTHAGFDFSSGDDQPEWESSDGYLSAWAALAYPDGYEWGSALWYTPYDYAGQTGEIYIQDMGAVSLDSVTAPPSDWNYTDGMTDNPLMVGHVYVVRTREGGYAKFEVISVSDMSGVTQESFDPNAWTVEIDYVYTSGTTF